MAGGSTITQQTAKIVFLVPSARSRRKYEELSMPRAREIATKKQILELYLNRIYLGSGAYGVDGAAHIYFGKSARESDVSEAAMLATLTRAPSAFSPRRDLEARRSAPTSCCRDGGDRRDHASQADDARANPAVITDRRSSMRAISSSTPPPMKR